MFDDIQAEYQVETSSPTRKEIQHVQFLHVRNNLSGQAGLFRTDVNPLEVVISAILQKMKEFPSAASQVDN